VSRCVVQSMVAVYQATDILVDLTRQMDPELVAELRNVRERKRIIEELEAFVGHALKHGAISATNAGSLLHPLQHELSDCIESVNQFREGHNLAYMKAHAHGPGHGHDTNGHMDEKSGFHAPFIEPAMQKDGNRQELNSDELAYIEGGDAAAGSKMNGHANEKWPAKMQDAPSNLIAAEEGLPTTSYGKSDPESATPCTPGSGEQSIEEEPDGEPFLARGDGENSSIAKKSMPKRKKKMNAKKGRKDDPAANDEFVKSDLRGFEAFEEDLDSEGPDDIVDGGEGARSGS